MNRPTSALLLVLAAALAWPAPSRSASFEPVRPGRIELTLDWHANAAFGGRVEGELARLQQRLAGRLCHPLTNTPLATRPAFCAAEPTGATVHVIVLRRSVFWRVYSTHPAGLEGPLPIGSVAKAVLAVPLLAKAGAKATETWCIQALAGLRNADGSTGFAGCDAPGARIGAMHALARSNNLATAWRLRQIDAGWLHRELTQAEVRGIPADVHPALAATLGIADITPRQLLECFDALARSGEARRAAMARHARAPVTPMAAWCAGAVATAGGSALARRLLAAPAEPGGTAAFLPALLPAAKGWRAKTGTPTDDAGRDTAKLLVFSAGHQGAVYTALIAIASPKPAWPLTDGVPSAELRGIANVVASEIAASEASRSNSSANATTRTHR